MVLVLSFAAGLVLGFVASMPPAGPIAILVLQRGILKRFPEGMAVALGGAAVEAVYAALALFGMAALLERFSAIEWGARAVAVAILLVLGIYFVRFRAGPPADVEDPQSAVRGNFRSFILGFGIAISNVTLVLTWSSFVAVAYSLGAPRLDAAGSVAFASGVGVGISSWFLLLLWALRRFGRRLTDLVAVRFIRAAGLLLLGLALFAAGSLLWKAHLA